MFELTLHDLVEKFDRDKINIGPDFIIKRDYEKWRELFVFYKFYKILSRYNLDYINENWKIEALEDDEEPPDLRLLKLDNQLIKNIEIATIQAPGRRIQEEYRQDKVFESDYRTKPLPPNYLDELKRVINKKVKNQKHENYWLVIQININRVLNNLYSGQKRPVLGYWTKHVSRYLRDNLKKDTIAFNKFAFERIFIMDSNAGHLIEISSKQEIKIIH